MKLGLIDSFLDMITSGNTPIRIIFFGGVFFGFAFMMGLASVFGVRTHVGEETDLAGALVIGMSLLLGFALSYSIVHIANVLKRRRAMRDGE